MLKLPLSIAMSSSDGHLQLYFDFLSQPSRALYILLQEGGRSYTKCSVNLLKGEHLTDEYKLHVNRFQKVPAIVDGDFHLAESIAILRYLNNKDYISNKFYPNDLKRRARVDEFLSWHHTGIRSSGSLYFRFVWVEARLFGEPAAAGKIEKYKLEMERDLRLLEEVWLKENKFVAGDELTAADVFGACEVEQIRITGYNVKERFPKVAEWIQRIRTQLTPYFDEAHQTVCRFEIETRAHL